MDNKLLSLLNTQDNLLLAGTICNHMIVNTTTPQLMVIMNKTNMVLKIHFSGWEDSSVKCLPYKH